MQFVDWFEQEKNRVLNFGIPERIMREMQESGCNFSATRVSDGPAIAMFARINDRIAEMTR